MPRTAPRPFSQAVIGITDLQVHKEKPKKDRSSPGRRYRKDALLRRRPLGIISALRLAPPPPLSIQLSEALNYPVRKCKEPMGPSLP
jgi:hypothetical protein